MQFKVEDVREKRNAPRIRFREAVQFALRNPEQFDGSLACDISATGLRLIVNKFVPLNTELNLMIQLEPEKCVECVAKVVWVQYMPFSEKYQLGLMFLNEEMQSYAPADVQSFIEPSLN
ncbi:MAG TPA: PilZ domain-containing protein [Candidatus Omnitrophota bacterium]|nr:PilZ domain-containing protein [Candidatus Omnitrophota bacterium]